MKRENHQIVMCIYSCLAMCSELGVVRSGLNAFTLAYCLSPLASLLLPPAYCLSPLASLLLPLSSCLLPHSSLLSLLKYRPIHLLNQRNRNYLDAKGFIFVSSIVLTDYNFFESKFLRFRNALINSIHCTNLST